LHGIIPPAHQIVTDTLCQSIALMSGEIIKADRMPARKIE
jgi:hypothetical protein